MPPWDVRNSSNSARPAAAADAAAGDAGPLDGARQGILKYQKNRGLDQCPGFAAAAQFDAGPEAGPVVIGLRGDGLELYTADDRQVLFDLEGRPVRFSTPVEYRFRGVSHEGSVARKRSAAQGGGFERRHLDAAVLAESCRAAWATAVRARQALAAGAALRWARPDGAGARARILPVLERIAAFTPERLRDEAARFAAIYQPVPVLPPDHYASLVLQATEGCSFNTCTFCSLYRGLPFRVRSEAAFAEHVRAALAFHGEGLRRFTHIFLGQANALAVPQERLVRFFEIIRGQVELPPCGQPPPRPSWAQGERLRFLGVGSFLDGFTGLRKSADDYATLRHLGLTRVYLGVESGSAALLRWLEKPATPDEMLETLRHLKGGGLATDVILLVGVGGAAHAREHVAATLEFLAASALQRGDRVYLSDLIEQPDAPYAGRMDAAGLPRLDAAGMAAQRQELVHGIRQLGLQAVPYRVDPFVY